MVEDGKQLGESSVAREGHRSDDKVDGREKVRNSLRAPLGGSDTSATTGWTDGKSWEMGWVELR